MIQIDNMQGTGRAVAVRKLVIKLGSAVVIGEDRQFDHAAMSALADSVAALKRQGVQVILVSSGAIGMGRHALPGFAAHTIPDRQALAAVGQVGLMHEWKHLFNDRGYRVAQLLLSRDDMEDRRRYLNARYSLERLLELDVVPIINENDTVTIEELRFGDNDQLSALVATKMKADLLVILTLVAGLFPGDPTAARNNPRRAPLRERPGLIRVVETPDEKIMSLADSSRSSLGTGGMITKLMAVRMAHLAGVHAVIACGKTPGILEQIATGQFTGTYFAPRERAMSSRGSWLAFGRRAVAGRQIVIDAGARKALIEGKKSLLAAGVREVRGSFQRGDVVEVLGPEGERVAKGQVNYDSEALALIMGKKTAQIREILGTLEYEEVIHRDNMTVLV